MVNRDITIYGQSAHTYSESGLDKPMVNITSNDDTQSVTHCYQIICLYCLVNIRVELPVLSTFIAINITEI